MSLAERLQEVVDQIESKQTELQHILNSGVDIINDEKAEMAVDSLMSEIYKLTKEAEAVQAAL